MSDHPSDDRTPANPAPDPPDDAETLPLPLAGQMGSSLQLDPTRQIFVNRNLKLSAIECVGFDMDYTLAAYHQDAIDKLSIEKTVEKMIADQGYPPEIAGIELDHRFIIRGLMVDKETGNIFKPDCHRHVGRCYHGYTKVPAELRKELYGRRPIAMGSPRFAWVDTLFSLPEATLLAGIIEHYEKAGQPLPRSYSQLFADIRQCIDAAHRDDSMKAVITADLARFVVRDPDLPHMLHKLRSAGKRLFLLTNSEWPYTDAVMSYLLDGALPFYASWRSYFDIVSVSAMKPAFFMEQRPFIELDEQGGDAGEAKSLARGIVYRGGNIRDFEQMTGWGADAVLYVGDHIYGDIVGSKKYSVWRTALIIQEMEETLRLTLEERGGLDRIGELEQTVIRLDHEVNDHQTLLKSLMRFQDASAAHVRAMTGPEARVVEATAEQVRRLIEQKRSQLRTIVLEMEALERRIDDRFNPYWGRLFREGNERSQFGSQVEAYACIYTSRVSNLLSYSPRQYFRAPRELMPHERYYGG